MDTVRQTIISSTVCQLKAQPNTLKLNFIAKISPVSQYIQICRVSQYLWMFVPIRLATFYYFLVDSANNCKDYYNVLKKSTNEVSNVKKVKNEQGEYIVCTQEI